MSADANHRTESASTARSGIDPMLDRSRKMEQLGREFDQAIARSRRALAEAAVALKISR